MKGAYKTEERLSELIVADKQKNPQKLDNVLKSDFFNLLSNYFSVSAENIVIKTDVEKNGIYVIKVVAKAENLKALNYLR